VLSIAHIHCELVISKSCRREWEEEKGRVSFATFAAERWLGCLEIAEAELTRRQLRHAFLARHFETSIEPSTRHIKQYVSELEKIC
jgi:hypothetical protein